METSCWSKQGSPPTSSTTWSSALGLFSSRLQVPKEGSNFSTLPQGSSLTFFFDGLFPSLGRPPSTSPKLSGPEILNCKWWRVVYVHQLTLPLLRLPLNMLLLHCRTTWANHRKGPRALSNVGMVWNISCTDNSLKVTSAFLHIMVRSSLVGSSLNFFTLVFNPLFAQWGQYLWGSNKWFAINIDIKMIHGTMTISSRAM